MRKLVPILSEPLCKCIEGFVRHKDVFREFLIEHRREHVERHGLSVAAAKVPPRFCLLSVSYNRLQPVEFKESRALEVDTRLFLTAVTERKQFTQTIYLRLGELVRPLLGTGFDFSLTLLDRH